MAMHKEPYSTEERFFLYEEPQEKSEEEQRPKPQVRIIPFSLADEWYAIDVENVLEIFQVSKITRVPGLPGFILGVTNIRGVIASVTDLKRFFDLDETLIGDDTRIILVRAAKKTTGLLADSTEKTLDMPIELLQPALSTIPRIKADYIRGEIKLPDGRILTVLNLEKIMSAPEMTFE